MPTSKVCNCPVRFRASWQPAVTDRASSSILFCANVDAGNEVETTIKMLQQTAQRPVIPTSLFSAPRNEEYGRMFQLGSNSAVEAGPPNGSSSSRCPQEVLTSAKA